MLEIAISVGFVVLFSVVAWAANAGAESMIWGGMAIATFGFAYGIPTAVVYHWRLYQSLRRADRLPARWWLSPTSHHALIPRDERRGVLVWGGIGGSGFLVIVLGIIVTTIGLWRTLTA